MIDIKRHINRHVTSKIYPGTATRLSLEAKIGDTRVIEEYWGTDDITDMEIDAALDEKEVGFQQYCLEYY